MSPLLACGHLIGESRRSSLSDILPEACSSGVWRDTASLRDDRLSHTLQEARQLSRTPHGAAAGPFEGAPRVSTTCEVRSGFGPADRLPPGLVAHLPAVGDPIVLPLTAWVPTTRSAVPARSEPVAAQWRRPAAPSKAQDPDELLRTAPELGRLLATGEGEAGGAGRGGSACWPRAIASQGTSPQLPQPARCQPGTPGP